MNFYYRMATYLIGLFIFIGCAAPQKTRPDLSRVTYRDLLLRNSEWQKSIKTLLGNARITLDSPQYSGNFTAQVAFNGNDSVLISVTGPLGIRVGKVFIASKRFIFYNQLLNQFYTGTKESFKGRNFLQFPVEITQLQEILLANNQFDVLIKDQFEIRDQMYYLTASNGKLQYKIWFDPEFELIRRVEYYNEGEPLFFKEYQQFQMINHIPFPRSINFVKALNQDEKQGLSIFFEELAINEPIQNEVFNIKVTDSAAQIDLSLENNQ